MYQRLRDSLKDDVDKMKKSCAGQTATGDAATGEVAKKTRGRKRKAEVQDESNEKQTKGRKV